jgi:hypothetical protein
MKLNRTQGQKWQGQPTEHGKDGTSGVKKKKKPFAFEIVFHTQ